MKTTHLRVFLPLAALGTAVWLTAAVPAVNSLLRQSNGEMLLTSAAAGRFTEMSRLLPSFV